MKRNFQQPFAAYEMLELPCGNCLLESLLYGSDKKLDILLDYYQANRKIKITFPHVWAYRVIDEAWRLPELPLMPEPASGLVAMMKPSPFMQELVESSCGILSNEHHTHIIICTNQEGIDVIIHNTALPSLEEISA